MASSLRMNGSETYFSGRVKHAPQPPSSDCYRDGVEHYKDRLAAAMRAEGVDVIELAAFLGVSRSSVYGVLRGSTGAQTAYHCAKTARFLRCSIYWLATGEGDMKPTAASREALVLANLIDGLPTERERQVALARIVTDVLRPPETPASAEEATPLPAPGKQTLRE